MKTLSTALVFCLSMAGLFASVRADALTSPRIEPGVSRPEPLSLRPGDGKGGGDGDDKGGDDKGGDDEEDEEDYRSRYAGVSGAAALELVDPGVLNDLMRLRAAARYGRY
ncbi:hypothetical protein HUA74_11085 [Myxococcus sp. CA051A]|uniref:Uncharacterized protein n=1 Tax=Myxococcus llanfairpwllgwyngyllgogerychwyrndrobwllllantysiliogogogochensis TaxID=2590453 RepID=A0A540X790_9BACT|nr:MULTISPECIES: hypothetical protein [Myxococcus]NTX06113.1 hypothetical protein [Myxococcus sp. CA040A]NTX09374.1 hypothetical protein [Myxococcus sp. CA056]NTX37736.1 hypothetical protein [Myxococcus sp. CA033]NTX50622.1 hypothetical protein [Myxococcus sp. CA039A]NTX61208.1 hypothetical protein [Myxococcus sp. CA051A]